jgi:16S rRNA (uracil1498-N3)-methyltransferase
MAHGEGSGRDTRMRPRFFLEQPGTAGTELVLPAADAHHAARVLRLRPGDPCEVVLVPAGRLVAAEVSVVAGREVRLRLGEDIAVDRGSLSLRLVQALPDPRAVDVIVAKGTEVGVDEFVLVPAAGSPTVERGRIDQRLERWRKVALEAAKQSKQLAVPGVRMAAFREALEECGGVGWTTIVCEPSAAGSLHDALCGLWQSGVQTRLALWIGPEGGWSAAELEAFMVAGYRLARLGRRILRAETAGPVVSAVARFALRDW